jgi:hypothetical protein
MYDNGRFWNIEEENVESANVHVNIWWGLERVCLMKTSGRNMIFSREFRVCFMVGSELTR